MIDRFTLRHNCKVYTIIGISTGDPIVLVQGRDGVSRKLRDGPTKALILSKAT